MADDYNKIFESLVEDEYNLIGLIAYGIYKQEKRKEIIKLRQKKNKLPTKSQIKGIESVLSNQLEMFEEQANDLLDATFEYLIKENKEQIYYKYFLKHDVDRLAKRPNRTSRLLDSLLFRFIWLIIIAIIGVSIYYYSDSLREFGKKMVEILPN